MFGIRKRRKDKERRRLEQSVAPPSATEREAIRGQLGSDAGPPSGLEPEALRGIQQGTMNYTYKGVPTLKCPFDLALYGKLLWELKPRTVIEIGSKYGGGAVWFADQLRTFEIPGRVVSIDLEPPKGIDDDLVTFLQGDAHRLGETLDAARLAEFDKPWLLIEDSSHHYATTLAVLDFFHDHLVVDDRIIVEDTIVEALGWADRYEGGPRLALHRFVAMHAGQYRIDRSYCDFYGPNVTWNPDGYLVRIG